MNRPGTVRRSFWFVMLMLTMPLDAFAAGHPTPKIRTAVHSVRAPKAAAHAPGRHVTRGSVKASRVVAGRSTRPTRAARTGRGAGTIRAAATSRLVRGRHGKLLRVVAHPRFSERFYASSFADNLTVGDVTAGEDPRVRAAAIEALGNMNGTAVAIDPATGRILAMVNQKLALSSGAEPCSTIKLTVALAALQEGLIKRDTPVNLGGGYKVDLTYALAKSVNPFFEVLGRTMGFERVKHYANQLGLGELAGYNIPGSSLVPIRTRSCRRPWAAWAGCARSAKVSA